jgi:hypothetical protein
MPAILPPRYLELVQDAALKSFWRRPALRAFLRRCGIPEALLSTWAADEMKRLFLDRLFPSLESSDKGILAINQMADVLVKQRSFPDLEDWEDSKAKKEQARAAVLELKEYLDQQAEEARDQRDREASLERVRVTREQQRSRQGSLETLVERLNALAAISIRWLRVPSLVL